ncbi:excalibur calcium-binding domain-containing protein [Nocardia callitridis]|uniref:Excalibur calcium-binding domain-containing protein n=1 Tax=Nocardia callitridis TaxID=648753 RepID=A0ABP9JUP2_9NOCA
MKPSTIGRRAVPVIGACLLAGAGVLVPQVATAEQNTPPEFVMVVSPKDSGSHPVPKYRPGPKGSNVVPPKAEPSPKMYTSCDQLRGSSSGPVYRGTPEYNPQLDRDHNGIACG